MKKFIPVWNSRGRCGWASAVGKRGGGGGGGGEMQGKIACQSYDMYVKSITYHLIITLIIIRISLQYQ